MHAKLRYKPTTIEENKHNSAMTLHPIDENNATSSTALQPIDENMHNSAMDHLDT